MLREVLLVALLGLGLGLGANAVHPDGLALGTNYFPRAADVVPDFVAPTTPSAVDVPDAPKPPTGDGAETATTEVDPAVIERLQAQGLQVILHDDVVATFEDPAYAAGLYLFVDARDDQAFGEGHIPGAVQFNHYQADEYIGEVLPLAMQAAKVVVYCIGGDCEDSEFASVSLMMNGIEARKLFVYVGGIEQWKDAGMPVETGS